MPEQNQFFDAATGVYKSPLPEVQIPEGVGITDYLMGFITDPARIDREFIFDTSCNKRVSNKEFAGLVKMCASALSKRGLKKGDCICLWLPNNYLYGALMMGASAIGVITTTANPTYAAHEIEFQLKDSKAVVIFTVGMLLDKALEAVHATADHVKEIICLPEVEQGKGDNSKIKVTSATDFMKEGADMQYEPAKIDPKEDIVCLPYSSGTTGKPKGVMLTHHNLIANLEQVYPLASKLAKDGEDAFLAVLPFFHIYGLCVLLMGAMRLGVRLSMMPRFDPQLFLKTIAEERVTMLHIAPPLAVLLAKSPMVDDFKVDCLKVIMSGAAPLGQATEAAVENRLGVHLFQGYGMTELSPVSHMTNPGGEKLPGTVGILLPNQEALVLDVDSGKPIAPKGGRGELLLKGPNVMKGYLNRTEATKDTIRSDGFMHTGDIVEIDENGNFWIVDRLKELIKYKGFQVPPAELEEELLKHPMIADAAVIGKPAGDDGELPTAYVVKKTGMEVSEDEVKKYIADQNAHYKQLRGGVRFVDAIPKSASGKILRRVLRDELKKEVEASA
eukprot:Clim_evm33s198 gene=Clim_evmTU33s198